MALNTGKILMRRGQEVNFDPNKMTPGEWAVSLDSKFVRMCFSPGVCVRMATYEAFEADMEQIRGILAECQTVEEAVQRIYEDIKDVAVDVERIEAAAASALESEENALNSANSAVQSAETAIQKAEEAEESANISSTKAEQATEGASTATQKASEAAESAENVRNMSEVSQSYAVGGTGTREGEDTDNAKYYNQQASDNADRAEEAAERASAVADVGVATTEKAGLVKPDGETIRVDPDGTIHADRGTTSYTDLENKPRINDVELNGNKTIDELGGLTAESKVSFSQASERTNIETTDSVEGIFGKIKKWFADLKPHAFSNPTNNLLATEPGTPLDALQGKVLNDFIKTMVYTDIIASDLNSVTSLFCETNGSTLNTPYKEGVTTVQQLCVLTANQQESYSTQFAFAVGYHAIFCRTKTNGTWGAWKYGMEMGGAGYSPIPKSVQITSDAGTISSGYAYKVGHQLFVSAQVKITNEVKAWDTSIIKISGATFNTYNIAYQQIVGYFYNSTNGSYDNMWSGQWEAKTASLKSTKNLSAGNDYVRVSFVTLCD